MRRLFLKVSFVVAILTVFSSCAVVKPYQRAYLNDKEMQLTHDGAAQFEDYYQSIREGSISPGNDASGEGCGCK